MDREEDGENQGRGILDAGQEAEKLSSPLRSRSDCARRLGGHSHDVEGSSIGRWDCERGQSHFDFAPLPAGFHIPHRLLSVGS